MPPGQPNLLLDEWTGPYGGVPAFDRMDLGALEGALEVGMDRQRAEVEAIAEDPEAPTFDNTILALERSGRDLRRVLAYWGVWRMNLSSPEFRVIETEMVPRLAAFRSKIVQHGPLFARVRSVYRDEAAKTRLRPDQQRLVWLVYDAFARNGATLEGEARARYSEIDRRLAELQARFSNNVLADEERHVLVLTPDQLAGLPESYVRAAAEAARERGHDSGFAVLNTRSSVDPFLTFSSDRVLRERVWRTFFARGDNRDEYDNNALIAEILRLRHERAGLLGHPSFAAWRLQNRMAKTPERALGLMQTVWPAAIARALEETADLQALADTEGTGVRIQPWDQAYYGEKLRRTRYALDSDELEAYLQLDQLREAMFFVAKEAFDFVFEPMAPGAVPVFHDDVRVWQVTRTDGHPVGLWYLDPFARTGKRSGAWATTYRSHDSLDGSMLVLASNNSNFVPGRPGEPVLISWDDARTLFHEFGHALHYLSSRVAYPTLDGGSPDFMELQSQILERWLLTDRVLDGFLRHHTTGEPIPANLVERLRRAERFGEGFRTAQYLASALVDMRYHMADPEGLDPVAFEREALESLGTPEAVAMRHRSPHFLHIFSGESYAAGYYGYMWADVLTADAAEAFAEAPGGFYDKDLARRLHDELFAPRNSVDPDEAFRRFRGRDPVVDALMRDRGFPMPQPVSSHTTVEPFA